MYKLTQRLYSNIGIAVTAKEDSVTFREFYGILSDCYIIKQLSLVTKS